MAGLNGAMNSANWPSAPGILKGLFRKLAGVLADCRYAQRRALILRTAPDAYTTRPDRAPDTYGEFLYRTSGVLLHEPTARARRNGTRSLLR
jgi:hypothetical protein